MEWTFTGGQRVSLFFGGGAQAPSDFSSGNNTENIDWRFSTSQDLLAEFDPNNDPFTDPSSSSPSFDVDSPDASAYLGNLDDLAADPPDEYTSRPSKQNSNKSSFDDNDPSNERRVARGGLALGAIFEKDQQPYSYDNDGGQMSLDKPILSRAKSDLHLLNNPACSDLARKEVDFNESSSSKSDVELADADTIKQKRKPQKRDTMGWQPDWGNLSLDPEEANTMPSPAPALPLARPSLNHAETVSEGLPLARDQRATMNLDDLMGDDDWMSGSAMGNGKNRSYSSASMTSED